MSMEAREAEMLGASITAGGKVVAATAVAFKAALVGASAAGSITGADLGGPPGARWLVQWGGRHLHQVAEP